MEGKEKIISEFGYRTIQTIQSEQQKLNILKKMN